MTTLINFSEYFKTLDNIELLQILERPEDYQPEAVDAARKELAERQLTEEEVAEAKNELKAIELEKEKANEKFQKVEMKLKTAGSSIFDTLNPIEHSKSAVNKMINLIVIAFIGIFLYGLYGNYEMLVLVAQDFPVSPFMVTVTLLPAILLPIGIITFWKRRKIGWIILTSLLSFFSVTVLFALYRSLSWRRYDFPEMNETFLAPPPITAFIMQLLFSVGTLFVLCRQDLRSSFSVSRTEMFTTIVVTVIFGFLLSVAIYGSIS